MGSSVHCCSGKAGVISGDGTGKFNPSSKINRASMASMLVQAYSLDKKIIGELPTQFKDLEPHWGKKQANILVALEISKGTEMAGSLKEL